VKAIWRRGGGDLRFEKGGRKMQDALLCGYVSLIIKLVWVKVEVVLEVDLLPLCHKIARGTRYNNN
jgi:hypothetical protein